MNFKELNNWAKQLNFDNDKQLIKFILNVDSNLYNGKNGYGEDISFGIEKGKGIRVSSYQDNGWIRINEYLLEKDDFGEYYIERTESYEK